MSNNIYVINIRYRLIILSFILILSFFCVFKYVTSLIEIRTIETMSWVVTNKVIAIDPGHGGYDSGAIGPGGTKEKDITLSVSKKLAEKFNQVGAVVIMTRDHDCDFLTAGSGTKKKRDLDGRLKIINESSADIYINIQANSFGSKWTGAQTFYNKKNEDNKKLAESIQSELQVVSDTHRKVKIDTSTYILKNIEKPSVLVEVGFISNPKEEKRLKDPEFQERIAGGIYVGIIKYLIAKENE
jgi:N-acetylmuramoyl-L-alanine amidase